MLRRYYAWQSLTASLLGSSNYETKRLDKGCVFNCIRQGIGPLVPIDVELQPFVRKRLEMVSEAVLEIDECMQLAKGLWQFDFSDAATGKCSGFPYTPARFCGMTLCDDMPGFESREVEGLPVDFVVRPWLYWTNFEEELPRPKDVRGSLTVAVGLSLPIGTEQGGSIDAEGEDSEDGTTPKGGKGDNLQGRWGQAGLDGATVDVATVDS